MRSRVAETVVRERTGWEEKCCGLSEQLFSRELMYFAMDLEELRRKKAVQLSFLAKLILNKNVIYENAKMLSLFLIQNSKIKKFVAQAEQL